MPQLDIEKIPNEVIQGIFNTLADLNSRLGSLEQQRGQIIDHRHSGLDSSKIRIRDLEKIIYKEATINPGNLADGVGETQSVAVSGAQLGDFVIVSAPYDLQDITVTAYVQAADTVEIRIQNESTATVNLDSGTWRILVIKKFV